MILIITLIGVICFLAGYIAGKRAGRRLGMLEGTALTPLILREQSLDRGRCCFCQAPSHDLDNSSEYHKMA